MTKEKLSSNIVEPKDEIKNLFNKINSASENDNDKLLNEFVNLINSWKDIFSIKTSAINELQKLYKTQDEIEAKLKNKLPEAEKNEAELWLKETSRYEYYYILLTEKISEFLNPNSKLSKTLNIKSPFSKLYQTAWNIFSNNQENIPSKISKLEKLCSNIPYDSLISMATNMNFFVQNFGYIDPIILEEESSEEPNEISFKIASKILELVKNRESIEKYSKKTL